MRIVSGEGRKSQGVFLRTALRALRLRQIFYTGTIMLKPIMLFAILLLISCNTPETRLKRLQHDFWEKFAQQDFFEIKLKNEVLHLPLPPTVESPERPLPTAKRLQQEANAIEKEKLSAVQQEQLKQIQAALEDCLQHSGNPLFDPSRCVATPQLKRYAAHAELPSLLEKLPAYYSLVEQRWQNPEPRFVAKAVEASQMGLDILKELEEKSGKESVAQTQAAIKDFIGLCQSAILK